MSGTTNSLIEIADEALNGKTEIAIDLLKNLENKYYLTSNELFHTGMYLKRGEEFVRDMFYNILQKLNNGFNSKVYKEVVATGELLSTGMFQMYLAELGKDSAFLPALNFMRVDKEHEPDYFYISENIQRELNSYFDSKIFITQGFICRNVNGEVDNLGRGGSDYTAAILGNVLNAEEVQIWTDIDGIHNNDPRYVANTSPLRELSFEEAAELAYFGAKILHPATIYPCSSKGIPVVLKNTLEPNDAGTIISQKYSPSGVKAVAAKDGITAIKIRSSRMLMAHGFLKKVFEVFDEYTTAVDMITTSEVAVSLTIDNQKNLIKIVDRLKDFSTVEVDENQTIICIVGDFVAEKPGYASSIFNTLKDVPVRMISYGGSSHNISILVNSNHKIKALQAINQVVNQKN
jgi:aspartate kinase